MANGQGTSTVNFGTGQGVNEASIAVTGLTTIGAGSKAEAFLMADDTTSDHTAKDHRWLASQVGITCGTPTAGTGFTIYVTSPQKQTGQYQLRWVWAD
jgi:hypothetical protein